MVLTTDFHRDVYDNESDARLDASKINGEVIPCYYIESVRFCADERVDGQFIGWLIKSPDGEYFGTDEFFEN